ncbi:hypothetical protein LUZ60_007327 [Juncus effusus]|nr:hypothetical protein LUZ60_007327 [Juncus effusus]
MASATSIASGSSAVHRLLQDPTTFLRRRITSLPSLLQSQTLLLTSGLLRSSPSAAGLLLRLASSLSSLSHSLLLFGHLPLPLPLFSVNSLLSSISVTSPPSLTIRFFSSLLKSNSFTPNSFSFLPLITSCARSKSLLLGLQLHSQSLRRGIIPSFHVSNALVHFYSNCGCFTTARKLFDEMPFKDIVTYNTIIESYVSNGDLDSASKVFDEMGKRNIVSWNILINGYVKLRNPNRALEVFREMKRIRTLKGTAVTMVSGITACARLGRLKPGKEIHGFFIRNFKEDNLIFWTALVDMYGKCRKVEIARKVFDKIPSKKRNLVSWNSIIVSHCLYGNPLEGISLFHELIETGDNIWPGGITYIAILCACARAGLLSKGQKYFNQMIEIYKVKPTFAHFWCLANIYKSQGFLKEAREVLKSMPLNTSSKALGGLLGLCKFRGEFELGERIAKRLVEMDSCNNLYKALLCSVYVASGKWKEAREIKRELRGSLREERIRVGHRLTDLNEIACNFEISKEVYVILDELAVGLNING